jgi:hypothetical protein
MFLPRDKTSVKFSKTLLGERTSLCSTATANPFVLASLSMKYMDNAVDWKRRSSAATMSVQLENDRRGRSAPLHRNLRRSPALIVCQLGGPRNVPRAAAMAQRWSARLPILQSAPNDLQKGKFVANAKPVSIRSQDWFDNLDKIDMVAFHQAVHRRS